MAMTAEAQDLKLLYEAAVNGCVTTLNNIIQRDPLILNRVSLSNYFTETPLHVSSLAGHLDFTIDLLQRCPKMAAECDSLKRLPIHLASAEGHTEIVKALLLSCNPNYKDVCLARDEDARIPLHLAAMRGRVDLIRELVSMYPESTSELLDGDTVFHMCVKYNHLEALSLLVEIVDDGGVLLSRGNQDGNTILHLAAMLKQFQVIRYLLSSSEVKQRVNALNNMELIALDLVDQCPTMDPKSVKIRDVLMEAGGKRAADLNNNNTYVPVPIPRPSNAAVLALNNSTSKAKTWFKKCMKFMEYDREEIRGALMIVATVIATMSYQTIMNPPGGVWQQNSAETSTGFGCNSTNICEAGTAVLGYGYPKLYQYFLVCNTIAFFGASSVIALVVSGFPLKNKFFVWLLAQAIMVTLAFLSASYICGMLMVIPSKFRMKMRKFVFKMYCVWWGFIIVAGLIEIIRFLVWTVKKLRKYWPNKFGNKRRILEFNQP